MRGPDRGSGAWQVDQDRLSAVACNLMTSWKDFTPGSRAAVDDPTWDKGCGRALSTTVAGLKYYSTRHEGIAANGRRELAAILPADEQVLAWGAHP